MTTPADPQPPMSYYGAAPNPRPTSVTVVAIISIIMAGLGILCSPLAIIPYVVDFGPPNPAIAIVKGNAGNMAFMIITLSMGFLNAILLLAASIACLKLKPWGRTGMIVYAVIALFGVASGTVFNILVVFPALAAARTASPAGAAGYVGGVGGVIFGMALPVVILIVMRRSNVVAAFRRPPEVP
jgi:hypothetical protein